MIPGSNKTFSVCTYGHAEHAWEDLSKLIQEMKKGKKAKILIGTGHAKATCQGAAFEYILNVEQITDRCHLYAVAPDKHPVEVAIKKCERTADGGFAVESMALDWFWPKVSTKWTKCSRPDECEKIRTGTGLDMIMNGGRPSLGFTPTSRERTGKLNEASRKFQGPCTQLTNEKIVLQERKTDMRVPAGTKVIPGSQ